MPDKFPSANILLDKVFGPICPTERLPAKFPFAYILLDKVFSPICPTERVYEEGAKEVALSAVRGINGTHKLKVS